MKNVKILLALLIVSYTFLSVSAVHSEPQPGTALITIPTDCCIVADAITNVKVGGTVQFINGTYCCYPRIYKSLSMISLNSSRFGTVIDGKGRNYYDSPWQIAVTADNVIVSGFTFLDSLRTILPTGIYAENCKNLVIANCTFESTCMFGIELVNASNIVIYHNFIDTLSMPLFLWGCTNITVTYNTMKDIGQGIQFQNCRNITFHHNNVFINKWQDSPCVINTTCTWDDGHGAGNYWSDYTTRYPNATKLPSGVWDKPYQIDPYDSAGQNHFDYYPLTTDPQLPATPKKSKAAHGGAGRNALTS